MRGRATSVLLLAGLVVLLSAGPVEPRNPAGTGPTAAPAAHTLPPGSTYHALAPVRILDSATGAGGAAPLASETPESFQVAGAFGIPAGATAVAGTLSITGATQAGYVSLTAVATSSTAVATSTISFLADSPRSAGVTATLGDDGRLWALYVAEGAGQTAKVAFDLDGYYAPDFTGATYHPVGPVRVFDSRTAVGGAAPLASGIPESFQFAGEFGVPVGATAVTGTLAIVSPSRPGRVALTPESTPVASLATSTLSLATTDTVATGVTATLGSHGRLWAIYETGGSGDTAQLAFDLTGYFTPDMTGSTFHRLGPLRLIDSRSGVGGSAPLSSEVPRSFKIAGLYGMPAGTTAVAGTLAIANATSSGYVSLTSALATPAASSTSSLFFSATGETETTVTAPLGAGGSLWAMLETGRPGDSADVIFDLSGYFGTDAAGLNSVPGYFQAQGPFTASPKDSNGVVMVKYASPIGLQYNTVTIEHCAMWYFDRWRSGQDTPTQTNADRAGFFAQIDWLVSHQQPDGRWLYTFHIGTMPVPWWSAMAEGQGISVMLRAYSVTGDSTYLVVLDRARSTFDRPIADLGVTSALTVSGRQLTVYEEYLPGYRDNVLNGWLYSLVGLYECAIYLGDPVCLYDLTAADRGLAAVQALLPYYDTGSWSRYNLTTLVGVDFGPNASEAYHKGHIAQLRFMYSITGNPVMEEYADRFQTYLDNVIKNGSPSPASSVSPGASR